MKTVACSRTDGVGAFGDERSRQLFDLELTAAHDDHHTGGQLVEAAMCYALIATFQLSVDVDVDGIAPPRTWPWRADQWHPAPNPKRNLEKAGALIAAEWDRLDRAGR